MARPTDRRSFIRQVAAVAAGSCLVTQQTEGESAGSSRPSGPSAPAGALSAYEYQNRVWVRIDGQPFACYRASPTQKYPYIYPITGPATGLSMTEEAGMPYPHHRSAFLGCDYVNGGNYWQGDIERGQIVSHGLQVESAQPDRVVITDRCAWRRPDKPPIVDDRRRYAFTVPGVDVRIIDVEIVLKALVDVRIGKTNHSLFAVRAAGPLTPKGGGGLRNAKGQTGEKATFGQVARWCGFEGTRLGRTEAIILIDHPHNPWSPCRWFTRDYGFMSPTPFYWLDAEGWSLPAEESVRLRYRLVVCAGSINIAEMNRLYEAFGESV